MGFNEKPFPSDDYAQRNLESQQRAASAQIDTLTDFLNQYRPVLLSAYDISGNPTQFEALCKRAGNWLPTVSLDPFDLILSVSGTTLSASIVPGTVNGILPSNIFDVITETYDPVSPITYYATLAMVTDGMNITSSTWGLSTSPPTGQIATAWAAPASFNWLIGCVVGQSWFRTIAPGSLQFEPTFVVNVPEGSITPGTIPYSSYFAWNSI